MTITYTHTSPAAADSVRGAKHAIREEAIRAYASASAADAVVFVRAEDGIYAYPDQDAADADDTGARAFAVIDIEA